VLIIRIIGRRCGVRALDARARARISADKRASAPAASSASTRRYMRTCHPLEQPEHARVSMHPCTDECVESSSVPRALARHSRVAPSRFESLISNFLVISVFVSRVVPLCKFSRRKLPRILEQSPPYRSNEDSRPGSP